MHGSLRPCSAMFTPISCLFKLACIYAAQDSWARQPAAGHDRHPAAGCAGNGHVSTSAACDRSAGVPLSHQRFIYSFRATTTTTQKTVRLQLVQ